jgi:hypothetical protein
LLERHRRSTSETSTWTSKLRPSAVTAAWPRCTASSSDSRVKFGIVTRRLALVLTRRWAAPDEQRVAGDAVAPRRSRRAARADLRHEQARAAASTSTPEAAASSIRRSTPPIHRDHDRAHRNAHYVIERSTRRSLSTASPRRRGRASRRTATGSQSPNRTATHRRIRSRSSRSPTDQ